MEVNPVGVGHRVGHVKLEQSMHRRAGAFARDAMPGAVVYTRAFDLFNSRIRPFTNPTLGVAMNQNVGFSGTPELIFDGGSGGTQWTGAIVTGTWNLADVGKVTITNAANGDEVVYTDTGTTDLTNRTALSGLVDLDAYSPATNSMMVQFRLAGVPVGNPVDLNDYIDTGNFAEQTFVVPLPDLGAATEVVDEFVITIGRTGGSRPDVKFDDFQLEQIGTPIEFSVGAETNERYHASGMRLVMSDASTSLTPVNVDGSESAVVPFHSVDGFLGVPRLTNGLGWRRVQNNATQFAVVVRGLDDLLFAGFQTVHHTSDGVNSLIMVEVLFDDPIVLDGRTQDRLTITVQDDLSGFTRLNAAMYGSLEIRE